jgi:predicted Rossmann fold flavoprotein
MKEADRYGVEIMMNAEVKNVVHYGNQFKIKLSDSRLLTMDYLCIACGGYPKSFMFNWITELEHTIEEPLPSLFTFNLPGHSITKLMGVSMENTKVKIENSKLEQEGPLLITHWGLSGPVILKLSAWGARELKDMNWEFGISVSWLSGINEMILRERFQQLRFEMASQKISGKNPFGLPQRLWEYLLEISEIKKDIRWADLTTKDANRLIRNLCNCEFKVKGKTTFKEEFVTAGGVKLNEVDANSMMSKKVPNLFFAGEVLDVDGITGGFNFQHAWTSGWIAAKSIAAIGE